MRSNVPHDVLDLASIGSGQGARGPCLWPSRVLPFWASWVLGGPRRHRWIHFEILAVTHPREGLGTSGIGIV
eukprot:5180048-Pyramimonas_sp.AAC.1